MGVILYASFTVAIVEIKDGDFPFDGGYITAHIQIKQNKDDEIRITGSVQGLFKNSSQYGFHIHEHSMLDNDCKSCGNHFNPLNSSHGAPGAVQGMIHFYIFKTTSNYIFIYIYICIYIHIYYYY